MEKIEGERSGSVFYVYDGYLFKRSKLHGEKIYLKCVDRPCKATGHVRGKLVILRNKHNHAAPELRIKKLKLRKELKTKAGKPGLGVSMRETFEEACASHEEAAGHLSYSEIRGTLYRIRQQNEPRTPSCLKEYDKMIKCEKWKHYGIALSSTPESEMPFYQKYLKNVKQKWEAVVFASADLVTAMQTTNQLHIGIIEATFKEVPTNASYHLITVHVDFMNHMLPAIHIIMSQKKKSEDCFTAVFQYISSELCPESVATVTSVLTDYEPGLMNAVSSCWANASVKGCFFHYAWAVYLKHQELGLAELTGTDDGSLRALRSLMALPLLPLDKIVEGFNVVVAENQHRDQFTNLCQYIDEYWLETVGIDRLSVYGELHRTSIAVEGYYSNLLFKMGNHPSIWRFTDSLRKIDKRSTEEMWRLVNRQVVNDPTWRRQNALTNIIRKLWFSIERECYSISDILSECFLAMEGLESRLRGTAPRDALTNDSKSFKEEDDIEDVEQVLTQFQVKQEVFDPNEENGSERPEEELDEAPDGAEESSGEQPDGSNDHSSGDNGNSQGDTENSVQQEIPYYHRYRTKPTTHRPGIAFPEKWIETQKEELADALTFGPSEEPSYMAGDEGQVVCSVCLTNAATRMAIPCAHYIVCRECLPRFVQQIIYRIVRGPDGTKQTTPIREPITCPNCRAIVGQVIPTY